MSTLSFRERLEVAYNLPMRWQGNTDYNFWLLNIAAYVTLAAVALGAIPLFAPGGPRLAAMVGLALSAVLISIYLRLTARPLFVHGYLAAQTAIVVGLMVLEPTADSLQVLFFVFSAQAMLFLPVPAAILWISSFTVGTLLWYTFLPEVGEHAGMLTFVGGYLFFGTFGMALRQSTAARQESQRLLEELQEANAQLRAYTEQAEQLAVAEERNRLAREMHDALGHRLTVAVVQLEGAQRLIPRDPERAAGIAGQMRAQLKQALAELRQTLSTLRRPDQDPVPGAIDEALAQLAHTFQEATGLSVHLSLPESLPPLPAAHRLTLYRAAQESLTNVQRHAGGTQAWLALVVDGEIRLTVADDGVGYPAAVEDGRFGLQGLQERAEQLRGVLELVAAKQGGAELRLILPLPVEETG